MTQTPPATRRRYLRGLTVVLGLAIASMVALSGQSAEAAASTSRATAAASSHSRSDESTSKSDKTQHAKAQHKNEQRHHAKQLRKPSAQSLNQQRKVAAAKQTAKAQVATKANVQAVQNAATARAAAFEKARVLAVKKAAAATKAAAARKAAAAETTKQLAAQDPVVASTVSFVSQPILAGPVVPNLISNPPATVTTKPVAPEVKAQQAPRHAQASAPLPRRLAQAVGLSDGLPAVLVAAFVLVFGFGLVVGGTTRRVANRTR